MNLTPMDIIAGASVLVNAVSFLFVAHLASKGKVKWQLLRSRQNRTDIVTYVHERSIKLLKEQVKELMASTTDRKLILNLTKFVMALLEERRLDTIADAVERQEAANRIERLQQQLLTLGSEGVNDPEVVNVLTAMANKLKETIPPTDPILDGIELPTLEELPVVEDAAPVEPPAEEPQPEVPAPTEDPAPVETPEDGETPAPADDTQA
jgi:hypothetical protein